MKDNPKSYTEDYSFTSRDADNRSIIKPTALINYFIQIAWMHAEKLEMGYSHLLKENKAWVLSKFTVELCENLTWPGEFSITTWPKGKERLFYLRDAILWSSQNKKIGTITSHWLVIDIQNKRPKFLDPAHETKFLPMDASKNATPNIEISVEEDFRMDYKVRYNDIDVNQHLTTVRYLELLWDTFDPDFIANAQFQTLHVNFIKEIKYNNDLIIIRYKNLFGYQFEIIDRFHENVYFRAELRSNAL